MSEDLQFMIRKFPSYRDRILQAYRENDEFKTLCEDFYSSALLLEAKKKAIINDRKTEVEYYKLFLDLESDVMGYLGIRKEEGGIGEFNLYM